MLCEVQPYLVNCSKLPTYRVAAPDGRGGGSGETKTGEAGPGSPSRASQLERSQAAVSASLQNLTSREHAAYEKLSPFLSGPAALSHKSVAEILSGAQVSEAELARVLLKLPHLRTLLVGSVC